MDISIHNTFLPHDDPEASLAFYRDVLGFEVLNDVGYEDMRWITLQAEDVDIVQEPIEQDWGARDCAVRDPAGNMVRIQEGR